MHRYLDGNGADSRLVVLRVCAWISHGNCVCSLARWFFDVPKTTSTIEQFAHGCKFFWIIAAQLCSAPHPLPDPLLQFWGVGHQVTSAFFFGSFLGKPTLQRFPIWIDGLSMVCVPLMFDNPLGTLRIVEAYSFCWWFTWKQGTFKTFAALDHARAPSALESSRPFEVDSWKKLWILDLLPWFLRWTAFGQANLECRCWNKRKDSTCWNIFRWAYCFKTCNFFLSATSWAQHER